MTLKIKTMRKIIYIAAVLLLSFSTAWTKPEPEPKVMWSGLPGDSTTPALELKIENIGRDYKLLIYKISAGGRREQVNNISLNVKKGSEASAEDTVIGFIDGSEDDVVTRLAAYKDIYTPGSGNFQGDSLANGGSHVSKFINTIFTNYRYNGVILKNVVVNDAKDKAFLLPWWAMALVGAAVGWLLSKLPYKKIRKAFLKDKNTKANKTNTQEEGAYMADAETEDWRGQVGTATVTSTLPEAQHEETSKVKANNPKGDKEAEGNEDAIVSCMEKVMELETKKVDLERLVQEAKKQLADANDDKANLSHELTKCKEIRAIIQADLEAELAMVAEKSKNIEKLQADMDELVGYCKAAVSKFANTFANLDSSGKINPTEPETMNVLVELLLAQGIHFFSLSRYYADNWDRDDQYNLERLGITIEKSESNAPEPISADAKSGYSPLLLAIAAILRAYNADGASMDVNIRGYSFGNKK